MGDEEPLKKLQDEISMVFNKKGLAKKIIQRQPCYYDRARNWWLWHWGKTKWERVDETEILNAVEKESNLNTVNSKEKNEIIEALKQESRKDPPGVIPKYWIQFKNTIVNLKSGKQFRAMPHWFVTNPIPWDLHKLDYENTPTIDRIFEEWVGKEYVNTLYEIIAYCMIPDYPIHRIFCFIGGGMNGKSCFLKLLKKFIGEDNVCSTELDSLLNSRFEITRLHKKLICQMGETNFNELNKTSMLKKLCGGDLIGFEYKNKDHFEGENYAKIIIATNNLPTTTDKTLGFYRRWLIIDFPNTFSEQKNILDDIPKEEYESLALKSIYILNQLLEKREFYNEGSIEQRTEKYETKSNFLEKFLHEFTIHDGGEHITKSDFYKKFKSWCHEKRYRDMSETSVGLGMKKLGIESGKKYFGWLYDGKGGQVRVWEGIKWKE